MNSSNQPCPAYPWCNGHDVDLDRDIHVGVIATLNAGDSSVMVDVFVDDSTGATEFAAQLGDWTIAQGSAVAEARDMRIIANKLEALLTTWEPTNAAVTL